MRCGVGCGVGDWQLAVYQFIDILGVTVRVER